ncbi:DEAD/DEAH box helicase [Ectothiorhodospiraceae bacterium BW-2]|nr:DEAD/DEAH box helicase [Ectothiorhodospiraceae bacterium BW-2]
MRALLTGTIELITPPPEIERLARLINTHKNPKYQQAIEQGRQAWHIEPEIEDYATTDNGVILPRGCLHHLPIAPAEIDDQRQRYPVTIPEPTFSLRDYQVAVMHQIGDHDSGVIVAPTGAGKTTIGIALIATRGHRALILVHTKELLSQWRDRLAHGLGLAPEQIGIIGGGKWQIGEVATVATIQTLSKRLDGLTALPFGLILVDECHHIAAGTFAKVIDRLPAKYRYGLSATPERRDGLREMVYNHIGAKLAEIEKAVVESAGGIIPAVVKVFKTGFDPGQIESWAEFIDAITRSSERNRLIAELATGAAEKMQTLILTDRVSHAELLAELTGGLLLHGTLPKQQRIDAMQAAERAPLTIGTTGLLGEGVDISGWQALILATPLSGKGRLLQAIGRVIRPAQGKQKGFIADLADDCGFAGSSLKKRLTVYRERNYRVIYEK